MILVLPVNDIDAHDEASTTCRCGPAVETENGEILLIHNAFDQREEIERECLISGEPWEVKRV